ncbi:heavy metal translocating P-type ATPase [Candidatus Palauibacter sp.]|uniref:heavy metal translocating P-type ATPase n=1 Tax=Candidatus Palauibacter sp. TaxID=3101350 RepID=UPI003CC55549
MNGNTRPSPWTTSEAIRTYASGVLWTVGLVLVFVVGHGPDQAGWWRIRTDAAGWVFLAGALVGGWNFFPKGVRAARTLRLDMNFLMTAAIAGAVLIGEPLEAAAIAFLFSLAELLESSAVVRARHSIDALLRLAPEVATLVAEDGSERTVPASDLRAGERVRVRPGEKVPIDGVVVEGQSGVNQANVTGESVPVAKGVGDPVFASTLNTDGFLEIEATTDAGDTTLHRISRLVREAQSKRSPTEQFVQKFARYYTPAVTAAAVLVMAVPPLLGLGTGLMWFERGLTLLVIACPCALVIATPVTIVSAITSAARHGVLIKGGEYVESLGATCAIAFDKTGTLTLGELHVTDVVPLGDMSEDRLVRLAATLERRSEHPIAEAIVRYASETGGLHEDGWTVEDFRAHPGLGVTATVDGARVAVGTVELLAPADDARRFGDHFDALQRAGRTVVVVSRDGVPLGLIGLADTLRPEAPGVLARLRREGVHHQILLTGDQNYAARAIGDAVGVDEVMAELKPEGKVAAVREIVRAHRGAAMVGDGVNDAPALAAADVGIAMGGAGSPATIETADIALMADDLNMLPYARRVSQLARRLVRFNIAFALGIKAILAVGAVGGFVSLIVAVLVGDMGASLAVTLNAMRLARLKPRQGDDPPRGDHVA